MFDLFLLLSWIVAFSIIFSIGGYIVDKHTPEDEGVLEYEKQIQERKRAKAQARQSNA